MAQKTTIERCSIDYKNDELPAVERGKVTFLGSRCVLWEWDVVKGGHRQVDSLTNTVVSEPVRGSRAFTITGTSKLLSEDVGVAGEDAVITVTITPTPSAVPAR